MCVTGINFLGFRPCWQTQKQTRMSKLKFWESGIPSILAASDRALPETWNRWTWHLKHYLRIRFLAWTSEDSWLIYNLFFVLLFRKNLTWNLNPLMFESLLKRWCVLSSQVVANGRWAKSPARIMTLFFLKGPTNKRRYTKIELLWIKHIIIFSSLCVLFEFCDWDLLMFSQYCLVLFIYFW